MPRVVHFDITADDPERASTFYTEVFGWTVKKWDGPEQYWEVKTGPDSEPGIDGGIRPRRDNSDVITTVQVDSVDDSIAKVKASGGTLLMPKTTIKGVGYLARCADTEDNVFGILEPDPKAK